MGQITKGTAGGFGVLTNAIKGTAGAVLGLAGGIAGRLLGALSSLAGSVLHLAGSLASTLLSAVTSVARAIGGVFVSALNTAISAARTLALVAGGALVAGLTLLGRQGVIVNQTLQQTEMGLATLLRSAPLAAQLMAALRQEAKTSAFEFVDLADYSKRLLAMGFAVNQLIPTIRALGDAAAALGGGGELLSRLVLALGQMRAKGKVSGEEMRQFAEAGIPAWEFLAQAMGKTTAEVMKLSEQGKITGDFGVGAIIAGIQGRFGGLQGMMTQTLPGIISNLKDVFNELSALVTAGLYQRLVRAGLALQQFLGNLQNTAAGQVILRSLWQLFDLVGQAVEYLVGRLPALTESLAKLLQSERIETWKTAFLDAFARAKQFAGEALEWIGQKWQELWPIVQVVLQWVRQWVGVLAAWVKTHWQEMVAWIATVTFQAFRVVGAAVEFARGFFETFFQAQNANGKGFVQTLAQMGTAFKHWAADGVRGLTLLIDQWANWGIVILQVATGLALLSRNLAAAVKFEAMAYGLSKLTTRDASGMSAIRRAGFGTAREIESMGAGARGWVDQATREWAPAQAGRERAGRFWRETEGMDWGGYIERMMPPIPPPPVPTRQAPAVGPATFQFVVNNPTPENLRAAFAQMFNEAMHRMFPAPAY